MSDSVQLSLSLSSARALSPSPSLSLCVGDVHVFHAHTKCFADNSLPFDDTPDTERPRTELKLWQEKRAESRHLLPPASVAPIKRQRDTSLWPFVMCGGPRRQVPTDCMITQEKRALAGSALEISRWTQGELPRDAARLITARMLGWLQPPCVCVL